MNDRLFEGEEPIVHLMGSEGQDVGSRTGAGKIVVADDFD
jgi:hypothetical protein